MTDFGIDNADDANGATGGPSPSPEGTTEGSGPSVPGVTDQDMGVATGPSQPTGTPPNDSPPESPSGLT